MLTGKQLPVLGCYTTSAGNYLLVSPDTA